MIEITCEFCQAKVNVSEEAAKQGATCPSCGRPLPSPEGQAHDWEIPLVEPQQQQQQAAGKGAAAAEEAASPLPAGLVVTPAGDALVVSFESERILDAPVIELIGRKLAALIDERKARKVALDFGNVRYLSSQMIGALLAFHKKLSDVKGRLVLCSVHTELQTLFRIVRLEKILPIVKDRDAALAALSA